MISGVEVCVDYGDVHMFHVYLHFSDVCGVVLLNVCFMSLGVACCVIM